jgi:hypothetical protein
VHAFVDAHRRAHAHVCIRAHPSALAVALCECAISRRRVSKRPRVDTSVHMMYARIRIPRECAGMRKRFRAFTRTCLRILHMRIHVRIRMSMSMSMSMSIRPRHGCKHTCSHAQSHSHIHVYAFEHKRLCARIHGMRALRHAQALAEAFPQRTQPLSHDACALVRCRLCVSMRVRVWGLRARAYHCRQLYIYQCACAGARLCW